MFSFPCNSLPRAICFRGLVYPLHLSTVWVFTFSEDAPPACWHSLHTLQANSLPFSHGFNLGFRSTETNSDVIWEVKSCLELHFFYRFFRWSLNFNWWSWNVWEGSSPPPLPEKWTLMFYMDMRCSTLKDFIVESQALKTTWLKQFGKHLN